MAVPQPAATGSEHGQHETMIIPIVAEEAFITKRASETGVRVSKRVQLREETAEARVMREEVDVRREPADEFVTTAEAPRQEGDLRGRQLVRGRTIRVGLVVQ